MDARVLRLIDKVEFENVDAFRTPIGNDDVTSLL